MPRIPDFKREDAEELVEFFYDETNLLANVNRSSVEYNGVIYGSAEQAYQAQKYDPVRNRKIVEAIINASKAGEAKTLSKQYQRDIDPDWDIHKFRIMIGIVYQKMIQHPEIAEILISTGNKLLVEDAPEDFCWGMITDSKGLVSGSNFMGRILMIVRKKLLQES